MQDAIHQLLVDGRGHSFTSFYRVTKDDLTEMEENLIIYIFDLCIVTVFFSLLRYRKIQKMHCTYYLHGVDFDCRESFDISQCSVSKFRKFR